jgi:hypothetical protein
MNTYWACFRTNGDLACSGDPMLYTLPDASETVRVEDFGTPDSRTLEIELATLGRERSASCLSGWTLGKGW